LLNNNFYEVFRGFLPSGSGEDAEGSLYTSMPGKIVKIYVQENQKVKKGDTLLILEAMKMENEIKAHIDGIIKKIYTTEGSNIESGKKLLEIEKVSIL
jgi:biotin carboxyl carrier protein